MEQRNGAVSVVVVNSIVSILCALVIGVIFDGWSVFNYRSPAFEFVPYSILVSLFFFALTVNVRNAFAVLLVLFFVQCAVVTRSMASVFFVRDIVFFVVISSAVFVHFRFFHSISAKTRKLGPFVLATLLAIAFLVSVLALHLVRGVVLSFDQLRYVVLPVMENGFLIGLGTGCGILLAGTEAFGKVQRKVISSP